MRKKAHSDLSCALCFTDINDTGSPEDAPGASQLVIDPLKVPMAGTEEYLE